MGRHPVMVRQVCPLLPFNTDQSPPVLAMAEFVWLERGSLELSFSISPKHADESLDLIALPPSEDCKEGVPGERLDNLWEHTCFEAFLGRHGTAEYWEFNASPCGNWNLYRFTDYRAGGRLEPNAIAPQVSFSTNRWGCRCTIQLDLVPWWPDSQVPELALTMVLKERAGNLSYWALRHPGQKPDFHDRRGFLHW